MEKFKAYLKTTVKLRNCMNISDTFQPVRFYRSITGIGLFAIEQGPDNVVRSKFNIYGLPGFIASVFTLIYLLCRIYMNDLSILRSLYDTKLQQYGDVFELIMSVPFCLYCGSWKMSIELNYNIGYLIEANNIDNEIQKLGVIIDYNKWAYTLFTASTIQVIIFLGRIFTVMEMSVEIAIYGAIFDGVGMLVATFYGFHLILLEERYKIINNLLSEISERGSLEHVMFLHDPPPANMQRALQLHDTYISEKIKACAGIYSMLYKVTHTVNRSFGLILTLTMFLNLMHIILYMFYIMEATASGMYKDPRKYMYLLIYAFWRIGYSIGVSYLNIYFSEMAIRQAARTSYIVYEIINSDFNPLIIAEATRLSWQLLHEKPAITACGLFKVNYELFIEGARSVTTFLVMLLQFATN